MSSINSVLVLFIILDVLSEIFVREISYFIQISFNSSTSLIKNGNICCAIGNVIAKIINAETKPSVILLVAAANVNDCNKIRWKCFYYLD